MLGLDNLYFKLELLNPSGSYKDRFAASAVSELLDKDLRFCLATSSGNTGAALAAYCAAADIKCFLAIVDGAPSGKIQQMQVYGAETMMVKDFGMNPQVSSDVFSGLQRIASKRGTAVQISAYQYSAFGMAGVQTISYEIAEVLPDAGGHVFSPAGGGGLTLAMAKGFSIWGETHAGYQRPRVHCVQPEGNDTIATPLRKGFDQATPVSKSTTLISGLQVPNVIDGDDVIAACRSTGGTGFSVSDASIFECQKRMAILEGIYCEPAGAVSLAGVVKALENKELKSRDHIVCVVTGHGFKDPASAKKIAGEDRGKYFNTYGETLAFIETQLANHSQ